MIILLGETIQEYNMPEDNNYHARDEGENDQNAEKEYAQLNDDDYINKLMLETHHFHHDYDHCKCPDCEGLGYFYAQPADLGGLGSYLFPKKECARCKGKGYLGYNK